MTIFSYFELKFSYFELNFFYMNEGIIHSSDSFPSKKKQNCWEAETKRSNSDFDGNSFFPFRGKYCLDGVPTNRN